MGSVNIAREWLFQVRSVKHLAQPLVSEEKSLRARQACGNTVPASLPTLLELRAHRFSELKIMLSSTDFPPANLSTYFLNPVDF